MAYIESWFKQDMGKPVKIQYLGGNIFSQDNGGNLIGVELFRGNEPYADGGVVSGNVIRADGTTVAVETADLANGNWAYVLLPAAAYAVLGTVTIIIKLTQAGQTTTIGAFISNVYASSTDTVVDPGTIIPSIQDLISAIDEAVDSIPLDYSALNQEVDDLKSALTIPFPAVTETRSFERGTIGSSDGQPTSSSSTNRVRSYSFFQPGIGVKITIPSGLRALWYKYATAAYTNWLGKADDWTTEPIVLTGAEYYKLVVSKTDNSAITIDEAKTLSFVFYGTDKTLGIAGAAADAKTVGDILASTMYYHGSFAGDTDLNTVTQNGMYNMPAGYTYTNAPGGISNASSLFVIGSLSYHLQIVVNNYLHGIYYRYCQNGTYGGWRMLPHGVAEYSSADDLNNLDDTQIVFFPSTSIPANAPRADVGGMVLHFRYDNTYKIQIYSNGWNDFYIRAKVYAGYTKWRNLSRQNDMLNFTVVKGVWTRKGTIGISGTKGICCNHKFELTPGSALDFYLAPGWTYTIREGNTPTNLSMTAHLSKARTHIVSFPYVAITFNKFDSNGDAINLTVDDFNESVIIHTSGDAQGSVTVNDYHDFPENAGQLNVIYRAYQMSQLSYTAKAKLYLHSGGSVESTEVIEDVEAGTELDGVPYSSMRETMASIPQATSFHAFMTMVENEHSYLYTKHYEPVSPGYDYNSRCYVGAVCSTLVAYCYGIDDVIPTTISFADYPGLVELPPSQQNPQSLKLADMLNKAGEHIVIVTDIIRTDRGKVKTIEVTEAWKPLCRTMKYTPEQIVSRYFNNEFVAYRYENVDEVTYTPDPWIHIDDTETGTPVYNSVISPRKGENSNWGVDETIEIDVMDNTAGYTSYVLTDLGDSSTTTASIPSGDVISLTNLDEGQYSVHLTDGTNNSDPVYFDVIEAEPNYNVKSEDYPDLDYHQVRVGFESATNRIPSAIYWCCNKQNDSDYKAVRSFYILTDADLANGYAVIDEPVNHRDEDTNNGVWKMRMCYKTEFGLFASPLVDVNVPAGT